MNHLRFCHLLSKSYEHYFFIESENLPPCAAKQSQGTGHTLYRWLHRHLPTEEKLQEFHGKLQGESSLCKRVFVLVLGELVQNLELASLA